MHFKGIVFGFVILGLTLSISGCSGKKIEVLGQVPTLESVAGARYFHNELTNIATVPSIGQAALVGASELSYHKKEIHKNIVVTSMVNVNNFTQSSDFGRLFSESMIANFKRLGWSVIDFRGKHVSMQEKNGEFYLSRKEAKNFPKDSLVFVGTYGEYKKGLLLNMRLLDLDNKVVTASNVQLNDTEALMLSKKSGCKSLICQKKLLKKKKQTEEVFTIGLKKDDCKNTTRCECENPNDCLCKKGCGK